MYVSVGTERFLHLLISYTFPKFNIFCAMLPLQSSPLLQKLWTILELTDPLRRSTLKVERKCYYIFGIQLGGSQPLHVYRSDILAI